MLKGVKSNEKPKTDTCIGNRCGSNHGCAILGERFSAKHQQQNASMFIKFKKRVHEIQNAGKTNNVEPYLKLTIKTEAGKQKMKKIKLFSIVGLGIMLFLTLIISLAQANPILTFDRPCVKKDLTKCPENGKSVP